MIDLIRGEVLSIELEYVVIETNGIGYQVHMTNTNVCQEGQSVLLYTHFVVREDGWRLFGFPKGTDRNLFRLLLEVSGIGPKAGLSMLAGGSANQIIQAIEQEDMRVLTKLPGVGKKTAQRMILELKEKLPQHGFVVQDQVERSVESNLASSFRQDVIEALVGLGYAESEAASAFQKVSQETTTVETAIKRALQHLMRG